MERLTYVFGQYSIGFESSKCIEPACTNQPLVPKSNTVSRNWDNIAIARTCRQIAEPSS
jgi:hypothetical protein